MCMCRVLGVGMEEAGDFDSARDTLNLQPVLRDTVTVESLSWIVIQFEANNPGQWLMHCHFDWHVAAGLALAIQYGL